jgi:MFS family permease
MSADITAEKSRVHPSLFFLLYLPYGMSGSYPTVTLAFLLKQGHVSVLAIAAMGTISLLPQTWKALWAPLIDSTLTYKSWYLISAVLSAVGMAATGFIPADNASVVLIYWLVLGFSLASTLISMTTDGLIAHAVPPEKKGVAAGWAQAGNLGGGSIGGGLALYLAVHAHANWIGGVTMMVFSLVSCVGLFFIAEPEHTHRAEKIVVTMLNIVKDVWSMAKSRLGYLAMVLLLLPAGTGSAANLWSAVADNWQASADIVALVTGVLGGIVSLVGALLAGRILDLFDRKGGYIAGAIGMALCAIAMAAAPRTPAMFVVFTLFYALFNGYMYAAYSAVMLEAIGRGAAATKSPLFGSLTNMPLALMTYVDGLAQTKWGSGGMLLTEAIVGIAVMGVFVAFAAATRPRSRTNLAGQVG